MAVIDNLRLTQEEMESAIQTFEIRRWRWRTPI